MGPRMIGLQPSNLRPIANSRQLPGAIGIIASNRSARPAICGEGQFGLRRWMRNCHRKFSTSIKLRTPRRPCVYRIDRSSLFGPGDTARTQPGFKTSAMRVILPEEKLRN